MNNLAINIENVSKLYRLGEVGTGTLIHDINRLWDLARGRDDPCKKVGMESIQTGMDSSDYIWALKNLNIEIKQGEIVGFIGSNGAGKSTLLKIISRITMPTEGSIKIRGRMASLLEIGTGMHPDMTARENIYMNGAILGMKRKEIAERFNAIIDFSGCSLYVDTPIKRFSSGMRVRLGFAVAAYLNSDLLIVDEVLAVGDAEFQQRAAGKINDLSKEGHRTVLFVSHNMETIEQLCTRCIVLHNGSVVFNGSTDKAIQEYTASVLSSFYQNFDYTKPRKGSGDIRVSNVKISNIDESGYHLPLGASARFIIYYVSRKKLKHVRVIIAIKDMSTAGVTRLDTELTGDQLSVDKGDGKIVCETGELNIKPGKYFVNITIQSSGLLEDQLSRVCMFEITPSNYFSSGKLLSSDIPVKVFIRHNWKVD